MIIKPDIELDEEVCIPYTDEIESWVEENLMGLRNITVYLFVRRDKYENVGSVEFVEKGQKIRPTDKPKNTESRELKTKEICDILMKLIQADYDRNDKLGKYKFQARRTMASGERLFSKHFSPPPVGSDQMGSFINNPSDNEEQETIPLLRGLVSELFDRNMALMNSVSGLFTTVVKQNEAQNETIATLTQKNVDITRMQMTKEMWLEDKIAEKELAKIKAKASAEKTQAVMKQLAQSGALKAIGDHAIPAVLAKFGMPVPPQLASQQTTEVIPSPPQGPPPIKPKTPQEEQAEIEKGLRESPLKTMCNLLGGSLEPELKETLQEDLGEIWDELNKTMISESEGEARENVKGLIEKISNTENAGIKLIKAMDKLDDTQKNIINQIMSFKL